MKPLSLTRQASFCLHLTMILDPTTLQSGLTAWLDPPSTSPAESAAKFANAIKTYTLLAQAPGPINPLVVEAALPALQATMTVINTVGLPTAFTQGIEQALTVFWTQVASTGGFAGGLAAVITPTLQPQLIPALLAGMAGASAAVVATTIATAIDIWTRTILITTVLSPIPIT